MKKSKKLSKSKSPTKIKRKSPTAIIDLPPRRAEIIQKTTGKLRPPVKNKGHSTTPLAERAFPIVGIGASAGGLEAFTQLFSALPTDTGMAFVIVQHLDPTHVSMASEILSRTTRMPVREVKDGMRVLPDHVYVIPSNFDLALMHGVLSLLPRNESRGLHMVIDSFFRSLAQDQKGRAVGVVLSGTASDGTQGLKAIKAEGGLTIAQDPKSAKYDGMPKSAIATGVVDLILPPEDIAHELARISGHPYIAAACESNDHDENAKGNEEVETKPNEALRKIFLLLRKHTQVDFSNYKHATLQRRIQRRMMVRKTETLEEYAKYLQENHDEIKALYADILINVTEFFRDPESFKALVDQVFPSLIKNIGHGATLRIWVPGCSTGEEAYSIAIALLEFLDNAGTTVPIQIFATDISETTIQKARAGIYYEGIDRSVSKERLKRFFDKVEGGYKISKGLRDLCLFSRHDVTSDPPFAKLDLVSCRNVLIYFNSTLQKRVLPVFHYALNPGGFLWLGRSESTDAIPKLFAATDKAHRIYSKINIRTPMTFRFPVNEYLPDVKETPPLVPERGKGDSEFQKDADRITLSKAPPSVVVNAGLEILQFRGRTSPYLEPAVGLPSNHLLKMARHELVHGLRVAIQTATKQNTGARQEGLSFEVDGTRRHVNIEVIPANPLAPPRQRNFIIFFEDAASSSSSNSMTPVRATSKGNVRGKQNKRIAQLEHDFSASKQFQQSITEDFESAQEELTAANEELQSTNEELQSTNEELETAKEELQSSNEELTTVNDEMHIRNSDLITLTSDLNNLLNSVEIPILIVGNDRRIRRFTPKAEKFFKLIPGDVGRPIGDIKSDFDVDLDALVSEVTKSLRPHEMELQDRQGRWMRLQIRPYKTVDNRIDGAVVALIDIEALKLNEKVITEARDYSEAIIHSVPDPLVILNSDLKVYTANDAFFDTFKVLPAETYGRLIYDLGNRQWNISKLRELLEEILPQKKIFNGYEVTHDFETIGRRTLVLNARELGASSGQPTRILLGIRDITERKQSETRLQESDLRFRTLFELGPVAVYSCDSSGVIQEFNRRAVELWGREPILENTSERFCGSFRMFRPDGTFMPHDQCPMAAVLNGKMPEVRDGEVMIERPDGSRVTCIVNIRPLKNQRGEITGAINCFYDVSERKQNDIKLAQTSKNLRLFESVTAAANEATSLDMALQIFLDRICSHAGWPVGHVYLLSSGVASSVANNGTGEFISSNVWHIDDPKKFSHFKDGMDHSKIPSGVGLTGKVMRTQKPVWSLDLIHDLAPVRAKYAAEAGIKSAVGFPVLVGGSIVAVLELFSNESKEPDQNTIEIISHVIPQLGRVFERKMSDEDRAQILLRERQARSDAEKGNRAKDLFLAVLSHELRTPLTSILMWAQMIRMGRMDAEKSKYGIEAIENNAKAQARLIDDLLDISRIIMGKLTMESKDVDPAAAVHAAVELVRPMAAEKSITIKTVFDPETGWVFADPVRLQQIVWNLLTNAIKFSPKNSVIEVKLSPSLDLGRACAEIKVIDAGKGIDPGFLPHMFDRFSQEDSTSTRIHGGLGLGLSIVRNLVELQSGTVRAESSGEGKGSTFIVNLPISSAKVSIGTPNTPNRQEALKPTSVAGYKDLPKLDDLRILFVDDDERTREAITFLFESFGAQVLAVASAREALAALPGFNAHLLVSDIAMPGEDGYSLIRSVRTLGAEKGGDVPALALTAFATDDDVKRTAAAGFQSHLAKPVEADALILLVSKLAKRKPG